MIIFPIGPLASKPSWAQQLLGALQGYLAGYKSFKDAQQSAIRQREMEYKMQEGPRISTEAKVSAIPLIVGHLRSAQAGLQGAIAAGNAVTPLTSSIPAFQRMEAMSKEIATLMLEVNKMRGL